MKGLACWLPCLPSLQVSTCSVEASTLSSDSLASWCWRRTELQRACLSSLPVCEAFHSQNAILSMCLSLFMIVYDPVFIAHYSRLFAPPEIWYIYFFKFIFRQTVYARVYHVDACFCSTQLDFNSLTSPASRQIAHYVTGLLLQL